MKPGGEKLHLLWLPLLAISAAAFAAEVPFFFLGTPSGHDVEFHLYSWLEVLAQWKQGIVYPRWAALAHFGYGEPRFIFYPPASWAIGAALSAIFPWTLVSCIYIWMVLVAAGISMFLLVRQWLPQRNAIFAAAFYAVNPYHLVIVYWRSAFAELLASCVLPLFLLVLLKAADGKGRVIVPLALLLAAAWLINAPAAVMIHYSFFLLIAVLAWQRRRPQLLLVGGAAVALGAGLAAFYLMPAMYEQRWVNIAEAISAGSRPLDNFLFIHTTDAEHDAFNHLISWLAVAEIGLVLIAAWTAKTLRKNNRELWNTLAVWAGVCGVLLFPVSALLWNFAPKLRFMQFPWRWLLCLSFILSLFVAFGLRRWTTRALVCVAMLLLIVFSWHHFQPPWWDTSSDLREMQDNMLPDNMGAAAGYEGTDEYAPAGADPSAANKDKQARRVTVDGLEHAAIHVLQWDAESKRFTAEMSAPARLALHLFNYPAWKVEVNGRVVQAGTREGTGQMLVPVEAGANEVQITFARTRDRKVGGWISLITALSTMFWIAAAKARRRTSDLCPQPVVFEV
ncbi:MAG TPA: 6-pyruvoyl-tetrahydropterin synthase-related protein [Candidatus Sulfotelmatobacter sp.]|nr:6-pyruvoyl-tetrahydropterin synthase-related protein [Candidatus Sulfotelmatobacter sp.]